MNTVEDLADSANYALSQAGLPTHPLERYYRFVGNGMVRLIERASGWTEGSGGFQRLFDIFMNYYHQHSTDKTYAYAGAAEMLQGLAKENIGCAVLSNKTDQFVRELMDRFFPQIRFLAVQGKRDSFPTKPNPASLNHMRVSLGYTQDACMYIGDSDVDVLTAHNGKLLCIGAEWGFRGRDELLQAGADYLAAQPVDVLRIVADINQK